MTFRIRHLLYVTALFAVIATVVSLGSRLNVATIKIVNHTGRVIEGVVLFNLQGSSMDSRIIPQLQSGESWNVTSSMVSKVVIVSLKDATGKNAVIRRDVSRFPCGRIVNVDAGPSLFAEINEFVVVE